MAYQQPTPQPDGHERREQSRERRTAALDISRQPVSSVPNGESADFAETWPTNFTKGLPHDKHGIVEPEAFGRFFSAINGPESAFNVPLGPPDANPGSDRPPNVPNGYQPKDVVRKFLTPEAQKTEEVRRWESPLAGHVYDLQGPDAGTVGMAPAPRLGSDELAAEMAEVYALALCRDTPFSAFADGDSRLAGLVGALSRMAWFDPNAEVMDAGDRPADEQAARRRDARRRPGEGLSAGTLFRGSSPGCFDGPYVSQFMLQGNPQRRPGPAKPSAITYGAQRIDQRIESHRKGVDYMQSWASWLDVQNGAAVDGTDEYEPELRFIATPRDLGTYVHFDALYQAYLNACLILLGTGADTDAGFPEHSGQGQGVTRTAFATYGGPHILSLVTEVATRGLKAVRRQKFNVHLRGRPEAMGAVATLVANDLGGVLGPAEERACRHLEKLRTAKAGEFDLLARIAEKNAEATANAPTVEGLPDIGRENLLLPMAFPEGSPMHPAYGAGHATVAGACVTVLKAFFEMFDGSDSWTPLTLDKVGNGALGRCVIAADDGGSLVDQGPSGGLTLVGELNKLAANISIGRNMAGVHFYTDYYDSVRMGERIAIGILHEQMVAYPEPVSMRLTSFDGDRLTLRTDGAAGSVAMTVEADDGSAVQVEEWWLRHVGGPAPYSGV